jgi:hypothetical protein
MIRGLSPPPRTRFTREVGHPERLEVGHQMRDLLVRWLLSFFKARATILSISSSKAGFTWADQAGI